MEETQAKRSSLTAQSAWLMFAKIIGFVLSFLLPLLVYRRLSQGEVGIYQQIFLVIVSVNGILPFGMSMSAYFFLSREPERKRFYIFNILLFNAIVGGLACLFLNVYPQFLGNLFGGDAEMTRFAPQIGIVIFVWIFSSFLETVAIANGEARLATVFIIFAQLTKMLLMVGAVILFGTVGAMLNAALVQVVLQTLVLLIYLRSRFAGFWHSFDRKLLTQQLKYALPFGFATVLWMLQNEAHNYFIGYRFSPEEMAIYRAGCFELPLLAMLYESISSVMIPRMSELHAKGKSREMIELTARAVEKLAIFYFPAYVFFLITAYTFITTLFTAKFAASVSIFLINITVLPFYVLVADPIVRAHESLGRFILKVRLFIVAVMLVTLWLGIQYLNLSGMIAIVVVTTLTERFIAVRKVWRTAGISLKDLALMKNAGKTAIVAGLAGIPTYFIYAGIKQFTPEWSVKILGVFATAPKATTVDSVAGLLTLSVTAAFFGLIYLFGINYWNVITEEEKETVKNMVRGKWATISGLLKSKKITQDSNLVTHE